MDLFFHGINWRQLTYATKEKEHKISDHLMCSPRTHHQRELMTIDYGKKLQGELMADLMDGVPREKAAQVRLDNLGQIRNRCQEINEPKRLERLRQRLELRKHWGWSTNLLQRRRRM